MAIERHEILGCEIARNRDGEREDKGIPVGCKRLARIAYVADAADICGKYRHAHHPARNGMTCRGELVGARPLLEERTAEDDDTQSEGDEDDEINNVH